MEELGAKADSRKAEDDGEYLIPVCERTSHLVFALTIENSMDANPCIAASPEASR